VEKNRDPSFWRATTNFANVAESQCEQQWRPSANNNGEKAALEGGRRRTLQ